MSSEITDQINTVTTTFNNQISTLESIIPTLSISATNINYEDDNAVVKNVETGLRELHDHITFFNDHVDEVGTLETAVIEIQNYLRFVPKSLFSFSLNPLFVSPQNNSLFNYFSKEIGSNPFISVFNKDGSDTIFQINKSMNIIRVGGCDKWISTVNVGGSTLIHYLTVLLQLI
jgi:hypothetical protein